MKLTNLAQIIRGIFFKIFNKVSGGRLLKMYKHVKVYGLKNGKISFGERVKIYNNISIYLDSPNAKVFIGNNTYINSRTEIKCMDSISIGNDCTISWDVCIMDTDYHYIGVNETAPVIIGNHVLIGCKSIIHKGVKIGDGSVIAAGSVVTHDIPDHSLAGGAC
ncbi:MAG: acyltransferase [Clostridia bacterium]|nr:acyltransferase [Clostridia bacterium]